MSLALSYWSQTVLKNLSKNFLRIFYSVLENYYLLIFFIGIDLLYDYEQFENNLSFSHLATFENERRRERQKQGTLKAKQERKYLGRKTIITKKLTSEIRYLKEVNKLSVTHISKITGRG
jgi:hypothetical protein